MVTTILFARVKIYKSNFFFILSNNFGRLILAESSGSFRWINIHKRSMDALNELLEDIIFRISSYDIPFILELEGSNKEVVIMIINSSNVWISLLIKLTRNVIIYFLCVFNKHSLFTTYLYYFKYFGFMKKKKLNSY